MKEQEQAKNVLTQLDDRLYKIETTVTHHYSDVHGYLGHKSKNEAVRRAEFDMYQELLSKGSTQLVNEVEGIRLLLFEATKNPIVIAAIKSILEAEEHGQLGNHTAPVMSAIIDEGIKKQSESAGQITVAEAARELIIRRRERAAQ
jgi:hypothetical protein